MDIWGDESTLFLYLFHDSKLEWINYKKMEKKIEFGAIIKNVENSTGEVGVNPTRSRHCDEGIPF